MWEEKVCEWQYFSRSGVTGECDWVEGVDDEPSLDIMVVLVISSPLLTLS